MTTSNALLRHRLRFINIAFAKTRGATSAMIDATHDVLTSAVRVATCSPKVEATEIAKLVRAAKAFAAALDGVAGGRA